MATQLSRFIAYILLPLMSLVQAQSSTVESFGFLTWAAANSVTTNNPTLSLFFDTTIYQCTLSPTSTSTIFYCDSSTWSIISATNNPCYDHKLVINNDHEDALWIKNIFVNMSDGTWYGMDSWCMYDVNSSFVGQHYYNQDVGGCGPDTIYTTLLFIEKNSQSDGSSPGRQIVHFDKTLPNQYIQKATWEYALDQSCNTQSDNFILVQRKITAQDANNYCITIYGTNLASIHTEEQNEEASALCNTGIFSNCIIGLNDKLYEKDSDGSGWRWFDGSPFKYDIFNSWESGEPNNANNEDCVELSTEGKWNDVDCNDTAPARPFLCNVENPTESPTKDPTPAPPTVMPTHSPSTPAPLIYTAIDPGTWKDNYEFAPNQGWLINYSPTAIHGVIVTPSTPYTYHGPYTGDADSKTYGVHTLSQKFYCIADSSVTVSYYIYFCETEQEDTITLYLNDIPQVSTALNRNTGTSYSDTALDAVCTSWQSMSIGPYGLPIVMAGILFEVKYDISMNFHNDGAAISRTQITCTPLPTINPTNNPTIQTYYPSISPSAFPTLSPTLCFDYNANYNSSDGTEEIKNSYNSEKHIINKTGLDIQKFNGYFFQQKLNCNDSNSDICLVECYQQNTDCNHANIVVGPDNDMVTSVTRYLWVICNATQACADMTVDINTIQNVELVMECNAKYACKRVKVTILSNNNEHLITASISCNEDNSCDNLQIITDNTDNIIINLNSYRYSEDVIISHYYHENINIQCGSNNDRRYIQYDVIGDFTTTEQVKELARKEYPSTNRLPCEDINIICENTDIIPQRECTYDYELSDEFNPLTLIRGEHSCYWLEIGELYLPLCQGTCGDPIEYYIYNLSLHLDLVFYDKGNVTHNIQNELNYTTKSYKTCHEFFGTINSTIKSLSTIDYLFNWVLRVMLHSPYIHQILAPPLTVLADNKTSLNCSKKEEENIVSIITSFVIESPTTDYTKIDALFDENSTFIKNSTIALSKVFGARIKLLGDIFEITHNNTGIELWMVILIIAGALFAIIICMICVVHRYKSIQNAKLESLTQYIKNPMVISIAIGEYDQSPKQELVQHIGGYCSDLYGIDNDIKNVVGLFGNLLNYEIFPEYDINNYIKQRWTLKEVMDLLNKQAQILEDNIIEYDQETGKIISNNGKYDGLIVIISCHGIKDYIVCSDYQKIDKAAIHRLFSLKRPKCRQVPRLFVYDCCSGTQERFKFQRITNQNIAVGTDYERDEQKDQTERSKPPEFSKNMTIGSKDGGWYYGEDNPDFKLATVHAANIGFQSMMRMDSGSYVISLLIQKLMHNIESTQNPNEKFLSQIMDEIQDELHRRGKQLPVHTFNNGTGYIKFIANKGMDKHSTLSIQKSKPGGYRSVAEEDGYHDNDKGPMVELGASEEFMRKVEDIIKNKDDGINPIIHHLIQQKEINDKDKEMDVELDE